MHIGMVSSTAPRCKWIGGGADERVARRILCGGIRAISLRLQAGGTRRSVFCVPVVPNFQSTFQWLRELRRRGYSRLRGIQFRIDDGPPFLSGMAIENDSGGIRCIVPPVQRSARAPDHSSARNLRPGGHSGAFGLTRGGVAFLPPLQKADRRLWSAKGSINASRLRRIESVLRWDGREWVIAEHVGR